jgi:hypothetical protein
MTARHAKDYADSGLTIREALLDQVKRIPNNAERPQHIQWRGLPVTTGEAISVPTSGIVRGEFVSAKGVLEQGFDIKLNGWLRLDNGDRVSLLRTWNDTRYEPVVEYPFQSKDGRLWVWNVYKRRLPDGRSIDEKWTENAGFWVEKVSETERIYHCSHGYLYPPDFESLVFKITINPR